MVIQLSFSFELNTTLSVFVKKVEKIYHGDKAKSMTFHVHKRCHVGTRWKAGRVQIKV